MKSALRVLAALIGLSSVFASAKVVTFTADNFSVNVPDGWSTPPSTPLQAGSRMVMAGRNPKDQHAYYVIVSGGAAQANPAKLLEGMKEPSIKSGFVVSEIRDETFNRIPFAIFDVAPSATEKPRQLFASAFTKDATYTIEILVPSGNIEDAKELMGIVQSFQFLTSVETLDRHHKVASRSEEIGRDVGEYLGFLLVGGLLLAIYFRSVKKKQQKR